MSEPTHAPLLARLDGDLTRATANELLAQLRRDAPDPGPLTVDLSAASIEDGPALVATIDTVRALLAEHQVLTLRGAPQILGHNLYRLGLLEHPRLTLEAMREDEPYG